LKLLWSKAFGDVEQARERANRSRRHHVVDTDYYENWDFMPFGFSSYVHRAVCHCQQLKGVARQSKCSAEPHEVIDRYPSLARNSTLTISSR
jgi:hypothetical protein